MADSLKFSFVDTDDVIQQITGKSPREIYTEKGPAAFMIAEENACKKIASDYDAEKTVISTGGGICDNAPALEELRALGCFVFLKVSENVSADRIVKKIEKTSEGKMLNLPAYIAKENPHNENDVRVIFHKYYEARTASYSAIADVTVQLQDAPKNKNLELILQAVNTL